jgi:hypothetical protein
LARKWPCAVVAGGMREPFFFYMADEIRESFFKGEFEII